MALDKPTLLAQLATLEKNAQALDAAIQERTNALNQLATDLERSRGARAYHDLLVQQVKMAIEQIDKEAAPAS